MKNLESTIEGIWNETTVVRSTERDRKLIEAIRDAKYADVLELTKDIVPTTLVEASEEDSSVAKDIYLKNKPELKGDDTYQLISASITIDGDKSRGIINARLNGEHIQIRF
jgi:hypothetical protein